MELFMAEGTQEAAALKKGCKMFLAGGEQRCRLAEYLVAHPSGSESMVVIHLYCPLFRSHGYLD